MRISVVLGLTLGLSGCLDQGLVPSPWGREGADHLPEIEVLPKRLDYGELGPHEEKTLSFVVKNVAESPYAHLNVHQVTLNVPAGFTFVEEDGEPIADSISFGLGQFMEQELFVRFAPDSPVHYEAAATVRSNDEGHSKVSVWLKGVGLIPKLDISPNPHDFGEVTVGCDREKNFVLTNVGNATLTVEKIRHEIASMEIVDAPTLPFSLEPGDSKNAWVLFTPHDGSTYSGNLVAESDDPEGETHATAIGVGHVPGQHREEWQLEVDPLVDVLFVVDRSASMEDDHAALSENFEDFIWEIDDYTPYWRIGVAMPDDGCLENGIIEESVRDYDDVFTDAVMTDAERGSLYSEAGLIVASNAVEATDLGECNDGFLRDEAYLHIILVADEPEQSPYGPEHYVQEIIRKKGDSSKVKISAVAGDYPWGCISDENSAEAGMGYYEAVQVTYGRWLSLCDSWYENANELAQATVRQDTFPLARVPDPATLKVFTNGRPASHWGYNANINAVVFDENKEPHEGWTVVVEYHDPYSCD